MGSMNDLSSVEWTAPRPSTGQQYPQTSGNYYPALRPTPPLSGRSTPSLLQQNQKTLSNAPTRSNASTPANDTFANLVSFNASRSTKGLSLQEQQKQLQEEKAKQEADKRRAFDAQFGSSQGGPTSSYRSSSPNGIKSPPAYSATSEYGGHKLSQIINKPFAGIPTADPSMKRVPIEDENDLLSAFDSSAPVDRSSHMPDISGSISIDTSTQEAKDLGKSFVSLRQASNEISGGYNEDLNDDPFGLGMTAKKSSAEPVTTANGAVTDNDDVLGLLGRPVSAFARKPEAESNVSESPQDVERHPQDRAVAELVDMGFPPDRARRALEATESGTDVQGAVGWLLNQAHEETSSQIRSSRNEDGRDERTRTSRARPAPARRRGSSSEAAKPAWMQDQGRLNSGQNRMSSKSPVNGEKDPAQYASDLGNKMFKTAGSLWKTGTKKLNQAVQEFNSDSDSSQPKWMKDAQPESGARRPKSQDKDNNVQDRDRMARKSQKAPVAQPADLNVTDEAMMLEADSRPPPRKSRAKPSPVAERSDHQREQDPPMPSKPREQILPQPRFMQQAPARDPKAKLSRQAVEAETSQAYISPARRKQPTPKTVPAETQPDLLFESSSKTSSEPIQSRPTPSPQPRAIPTTSIPSRQPAPKRNVPSLSSFALQASTRGRQEGNAAFKRGDYAQATTHYSSSLSAIPTTHPLAIVILTNRALSHSKIGDPKASIADAKSALDLIGSSKGLGEMIDLGDEGSKQMSAYWEKAMMRQAEALEHLERWSEAAVAWRSCVEAGVGGATSSAGRNRCEKAAAPASQSRASSAPKKPIMKARPKPTALGDLAPDSESVTRLRAANAAADRLDDEKFALADIVDQRVSRWRAGKEGNLRALLSTLETVLWEDSGWKKVGMGDVLLPGKVKLVYMKGIAKVHPDKVSARNWVRLLLAPDNVLRSFLRPPPRSRR